MAADVGGNGKKAQQSAGGKAEITGAEPGQASWQAQRATVRERNAMMFNNALISDVTFVVGPQGASQRIPGHKYLLGVSSSVFYAMFYGELAEEKSEIVIPDAEPPAFLAMLKYIYCDEMDLDADSVLATLYVAKKYMVLHLARACVSFLKTSLTARNACVLLAQSRLFEEPELADRCWEVIDAQAELALRSDSFCDVDLETLAAILSRETLNAAETVVFEAALGWAAAECRRSVATPTPGNMRSALGKALHLLRLPAMPLSDFADGPAQSGVLDARETLDVFLWHTARGKPELPFPTAPRRGLQPRRCCRFQSCTFRSNQWRYHGRCDAVQFSVDRRIFLGGFGLFGSSGARTEYAARVELKRGGTVVAHRASRFTADGTPATFPVYFEHPVQVEPDAFYTASVVLDGPSLSYFGQDGLTEVQCEGIAFQFQCSSDSTNGTGVQGGQIPELIFYS
ncbi:BTB/POZ domain-containing protein 3-like isoform X1 [Lethenteron reissneri]|uniref:BTB/POZ domain-containing protein 3-like isoform X1 n=2 Tax=Lethenteron reissneri TaxID=7753 RepID=UPI002AB78E27|nr:BTB/POZ domain-containing protein 3-like isoform X1 [Lethenteron reissneri]